MRGWLILLGGLLFWAVHFFALYAAGEFGDGSIGLRIAIGVLSLSLLAADAALLAGIHKRHHSDFVGRRDQIGALGALLAAVAMLWQGLPVRLIGQG